MNSKYNRYGINKNTYDLLFNEKEEYKKECSKELMTVELFLSNPKTINRKTFLWLERLIEMQYYKINYFNIRKKLLSDGYIYKDKNIKFFVIKRSEDSPPTKSGLVNNQIVIGDELIKVENESISITNKSYIQKADKSLYRIHLVLINEKKNKEMVFETLVPTINDLEEE